MKRPNRLQDDAQALFDLSQTRLLTGDDADIAAELGWVSTRIGHVVQKLRADEDGVTVLCPCPDTRRALPVYRDPNRGDPLVFVGCSCLKWADEAIALETRGSHWDAFVVEVARHRAEQVQALLRQLNRAGRADEADALQDRLMAQNRAIGAGTGKVKELVTVS